MPVHQADLPNDIHFPVFFLLVRLLKAQTLAIAPQSYISPGHAFHPCVHQNSLRNATRSPMTKELFSSDPQK